MPGYDYIKSFSRRRIEAGGNPMNRSELPRQTPHELACAEPVWQQSSYCASGECVEVARQHGLILLRDSKQSASSVLRCTAEEWRSLVRAIKAGEFGLG
jgi:hypothetical protein